MGTNKDQAQAQAFMLQRVISALTVHETDPEQPPFRRPLLSAIWSIVIGILITAGFWVFGLFVPGGDRFEETDVIAIEEETGARWVLLNGQRHLAINYTSALLALDQHAEVRMVPRAELAGIPVGPPIGILGAPDSLPGKDDLLTDAWSMCDQSTMDDQGRRRDTPVLLVGQRPDQGRALKGQALLVHADRQLYVIHEGYRHEIAKDVDVALGLDKQSPVGVSDAFLNSVPAGKPIAPIALAEPGRPSAAVPGRELVSGQLLDVDGGASYFLVSGDQLLPISPLAAAIQRVLGPHADPPVQVTNRETVGAKRASPVPTAEDDPPWTRPEFQTVDDPNATVCATFRPGTTVPSLAVDVSLPSSVLSAPAGPVRVAVPSGRAALVEVMTSADQPPGQGTIALVTDQGRLYSLDEDPGHVLQVLGYDGVQPIRITATLADRIPRGRSLNPNDARTPVSEDQAATEDQADTPR